MTFLGQLFRISNSSSFGLIVNLYRDHTMNLLIGPLLLNPEDRLSEGAKVNAMSRLASILLADFAIGSILDSLGNLILNEGRIDVQYRWVIESPGPGIIDRQSLFEHCKLVFYLSIQRYFWDGVNLTLFSSFYIFTIFV